MVVMVLMPMVAPLFLLEVRRIGSPERSQFLSIAPSLIIQPFLLEWVGLLITAAYEVSFVKKCLC